MTKRALLAAALLGLAAAPVLAQQQPPSPPQPQPATVVVVGQVIDAGTKAPIQGVNIKIPGARVHVVTGADGQFRMRVPPGAHGVALARLGYQSAIEQWQVGTESLDVGILTLDSDPVVLEGITATADRLDRVRRAVAMPSRSYGADDLINNASFNAADFVASRAATMIVDCESGRSVLAGRGARSPAYTGRNCVIYHGHPARVCIVVDDSPVMGGLEHFQAYQTHEFARMHVYRGGTFVQAYTAAYIKRLIRENRRPDDALSQIERFCRRTI